METDAIWRLLQGGYERRAKHMAKVKECLRSMIVWNLKTWIEMETVPLYQRLYIEFLNDAKKND